MLKFLTFPALVFSFPLGFLASGGSPAFAAEGAVSEVVEVVKEAVGLPLMSPEERAAKLGFAGHVAADADLYMAIYDGAGMVRGLGGLKVWDFIRSTAKEEGVDAQEQVGGVGAQIEPVLGKEMFLAFGAGTAKQLDGLNEISQRMNYYQFRMMSRAFAKGAVEGDIEGEMEEMEDAWLADFGRDLGRYMPMFEAAEFPPLLAGLRITDGDQIGGIEQQLRDLLGMIGEGAEAVNFEKGGATFAGYLFKGEMLAEGAAGDREEMDETIGAENTDRMLAALRKKQLVVCVGRLGEYLLLYFGPSAVACPVADDLGGSLAASEEIGFIDSFKDVPVHGMVYGTRGVVASSVTQSLKQIAEGCRDGIQGVEGFGNTRELVALLDMMGEREKALLDLVQPGTLGAVISVDGGARFDLFGGAVAGAIDYQRPHRLTQLGEGEDVLLFANWANQPEYAERAADLVELAMETVYATAGHLSGLGVESDELAQVQAGYEMFDGLLREDLLSLWGGLGALNDGLGDEGALVVDFKAGFPPLPGVPLGVVEEGRFPRISYIAPVRERAKLKESWATVEAAVRSLLKKANEMGEMKLHLPAPTSSEKNEIATWYFDALAFNDDLKPSVTLSDEWFVGSTSRTQALDLMARAGQGGGDRRGLWVKLDLEVLRKYLVEVAKLADKHGAEVFPDPDGLADFREELPRVLEGLASLEEFKAVTVHERMENGMRRATLRFNVH